MFKRKLLVAVIAVALLAILLYVIAGVRPAIKNGDNLSFVQLPSGFTIETFAEGLGGSSLSTPGPSPGVRFMLLKDGVLYATIPSQGRVVALRDTNGDRKVDSVINLVSNLSSPHGIDFADGWFYVAEETGVIRFKDSNNDFLADANSIEKIIDGVTTGRLLHGGHFTRTIKIHDGKLYFSAGSSCNVCREESEWRAAITQCNLDGSDCKVFAKGLRNAVGIVFHPVTGELYATENGRDGLGEDVPPDEINLVKDGGNYGWPICYGKNTHDTEFDQNTYIRNPCMEPFETPSLVDLQAHSAPLGLSFYFGSQFPSEYAGKLFAAYHGSWNRGDATGYKIVKIDVDTGKVEDFATGWLQGSNVLGRPVDIIVDVDGSLLVSDDNAGKIYRIYYN